MKSLVLAIAVLGWSAGAVGAAEFTPAPQEFLQEVAVRFGEADGLPAGPIRVLDRAPGGQGILRSPRESGSSSGPDIGRQTTRLLRRMRAASRAVPEKAES